MKPVDPRIQQIYDNIATYQAIALADYGVPAWQALPVASLPDAAFRPSCGQLEGTWVSGGTDWYWGDELLYSVPNRHNSLEAGPNLQAAGICITGTHAVEVPMVPTDEVFAQFQAQVQEQAQPRPVALPGESPVAQATQPAATTTEAPTPTTAGFPVLPVLGLVVVCVALALAFPHLIRAWDGLGARLVRGKGGEKPAAQAPEPKVTEEDFELEL